MNRQVSLVIPARDEEDTIGFLVTSILNKSGPREIEVIVVDDGSIDSTSKIAIEAGATVIRHPVSLGNGAAIKTGARIAKYSTLVFMDGDGQHSIESVLCLLDKFDLGWDLVVGARVGASSQSSIVRWLGNTIYNGYASFLTGVNIMDLTSGLRVVNRAKFLEILHLLPNKFSYPTTSTIAFIRLGFSVTFEPVEVQAAKAGSHINIVKDGLRFFAIIFKTTILYSPFKFLMPLSAASGFVGLGLYITSFLDGSPRFTNGMGFMFSSSMLTFAVALIAEQMTMLLYSRK